MSNKSDKTLNTIKTWLEALPSSERVTSKDTCVEGIFNAVKHVGYGYPFDREQREINDLLLASLAGEAACKTVWQFYHEKQYIKATQHERRKHPRKNLVT